jgi:predicted nucleic-acid-binding protein
MLAIDTNVLIRYVVSGDSDQLRRATALVENHPIFVATTVLLESEWVLRAIYGCTRVQVFVALRGFTTLATVTMENFEVAERALGWAERGMDLADALHLSGSGDCDAFASFDAKLAKAAKRMGATKVRAP